MIFWMTVVFTFLAFFFLEAFVLGILRAVGFYTIVKEREARVYVLFGRVLGVLDEPGLYFLWGRFGWRALLIGIFGETYIRDLRLDQTYIRSTPVNSEEGAPMGIGVWYEMNIIDPVAHVFKNIDPSGSLRANVSNATVRCLSNMRLGDMLEDRHRMSQTVREEVSPHSKEWGYRVGSVYIRKVHFRDVGMIRQIEEKVVNRLRQVTAAIKQEGSNQVNIISSTAEREAATEFARAAAMRPRIVGEALQAIGQNRQVSDALFDLLETQKILEGKADVIMLPVGSRDDQLAQLTGLGSSDAPPPKQR
jgi:regulator of protease activity HflC (stomatin/prohibitin superfamily)